ncbi:MAG: Holliday junction resolvase RuvX [Bacillota bacterium]|nr:Holliday junction resolvase RuvX [Bacillota bacterium]
MLTQTGKWMGVDFGLARIGVAVSDPLGILANGLETIRWNGRDADSIKERLVYLVKQQNVQGIVMGYPSRTDGKQASLTGMVRDLAAELEQVTGVPVLLRDERFTTVMARRKLQESGVKAKRQKPVIDQVAAEIILQEYLESRRKALQ